MTDAPIDTSLQKRYYSGMISYLVHLVRRRWPGFEQLTDRERALLISDIALVSLSLPLGVLALAVLAAVSSPALMRSQWPAALIILTLGVSLTHIGFFQILGARAGEYSYTGATLLPVLANAALLLFGPSSIWLIMALDIPFYFPRLRHAQSTPQRWTLARNWLYSVWNVPLSMLLALLVYRLAGGVIPLPDLSWRSTLPGFLAVLASLVCQMASLILLMAIHQRSLRALDQPATPRRRWLTLRFSLIAEISAFFGIMAAALYSQNGVWGFLFFMLGVHLVSLLARRLSKAAMLSQEQSREVTQLERLGRAIIAAPPGALDLPALLAEYVPAMFRYRQIEIRLFPDQTLLHLPEGQPAPARAAWEWLAAHAEYCDIKVRQTAPWEDRPARDRLVLCPIMTSDTGQPLGGICLTEETNIFEDLAIDLQPPMQTLAAQIASALHSVEAYRRDLQHQRVAQELAVAGQIQATFLPPSLPALSGWQLVADLQPARETSGDFYDAFDLPGGKLGFLVADVSDKGMGAALVMALSRTLLRTYAYEYHAQPDDVLRIANRRILADTQSGLFVSAFYGVIDPGAGIVTYANAGHNPPYLLRNHGSASTAALTQTGMVLGVLDDVEWESVTIAMQPGDMLVIYSDGVSDALNEADEFFGEERLRALVEQHRSASAQQMLDAIVETQRRFVGRRPWFDDATLMVLKRE